MSELAGLRRQLAEKQKVDAEVESSSIVNRIRRRHGGLDDLIRKNFGIDTSTIGSGSGQQQQSPSHHRTSSPRSNALPLLPQVQPRSSSTSSNQQHQQQQQQQQQQTYSLTSNSPSQSRDTSPTSSPRHSILSNSQNVLPSLGYSHNNLAQQQQQGSAPSSPLSASSNSVNAPSFQQQQQQYYPHQHQHQQHQGRNDSMSSNEDHVVASATTSSAKQQRENLTVGQLLQKQREQRERDQLNQMMSSSVNFSSSLNATSSPNASPHSRNLPPVISTATTAMTNLQQQQQQQRNVSPQQSQRKDSTQSNNSNYHSSMSSSSNSPSYIPSKQSWGDAGDDAEDLFSYSQNQSGGGGHSLHHASTTSSPTTLQSKWSSLPRLDRDGSPSNIHSTSGSSNVHNNNSNSSNNGRTESFVSNFGSSNFSSNNQTRTSSPGSAGVSTVSGNASVAGTLSPIGGNSASNSPGISTVMIPGGGGVLPSYYHSESTPFASSSSAQERAFKPSSTTTTSSQSQPNTNTSSNKKQTNNNVPTNIAELLSQVKEDTSAELHQQHSGGYHHQIHPPTHSRPQQQQQQYSQYSQSQRTSSPGKSSSSSTTTVSFAPKLQNANTNLSAIDDYTGSLRTPTTTNKTTTTATTTTTTGSSSSSSSSTTTGRSGHKRRFSDNVTQEDEYDYDYDDIFPEPTTEQLVIWKRIPFNRSPMAKTLLREPFLPPQPSNVAGRVTLVLDIDETLLHASFDLNKPYNTRLTVEVDGESGTIGVAFRPHLDKFLSEVCRLFEIVIFTASHHQYAHQLMNAIDPKGYLGKLRLCRDKCTETSAGRVKDLWLLGRPLERLVILDNSPVSYAFQRRNALPITNFFSDRNDTALLNILPVLKELARCPNVYEILDPFNAALMDV